MPDIRRPLALYRVRESIDGMPVTAFEQAIRPDVLTDPSRLKNLVDSQRTLRVSCPMLVINPAGISSDRKISPSGDTCPDSQNRSPAACAA